MAGYYRAAVPPAIHDLMVTGINVPIHIGGATVMPGDVGSLARLLQSVRVQRVATGHEHVLLAVQLVSHRRARHPADIFVPHGRVSVVSTPAEELPLG